MSDIKTIKVRGGGDYAPVAERVKAAHEDHADLSIETDYDVTEKGWVICRALVTIVGEHKTGKYNGHSLGKIGTDDEKAFEKLETVAVGRALAFAGYLAGGEIASYDEMEKWQDNSGMEI